MHKPKRWKWRLGLRGEGGKGGAKNPAHIPEYAWIFSWCSSPTWHSSLHSELLTSCRTLRVWGHSKSYRYCSTRQTNLSPCSLLMKCCELSVSREKPKYPTPSHVDLDESSMKFTSVFLFCKINAISHLPSQRHHPSQISHQLLSFLNFK